MATFTFLQWGGGGGCCVLVHSFWSEILFIIYEQYYKWASLNVLPFCIIAIHSLKTRLTPFNLCCCCSAAVVDVWAACSSDSCWDGAVVPSGGTGSLGARGVTTLSTLEALSTGVTAGGVTGLLFTWRCWDGSCPSHRKELDIWGG